jgi:hypothetical protein
MDFSSKNAECKQQYSTAADTCKPALDKCKQDCQGKDKNKCDAPAAVLSKLLESAGACGKGEEGGKKTGENSGGSPQMPQMPQQQQADNQPSPTPTPVTPPASASADCATNPASDQCPKPVVDSQQSDAKAAAFNPATGGTGGVDSSGGGSSAGADAPASASNAAMTPGGGPMGGGGGGLGLGGSGSSKENPPPLGYADAAKSITDVLNGERSGGGGAGSGGGGFSYGGGENDLAKYLPGGAKDPTRKLASASATKPGTAGHPEIAAAHLSIFDLVSKRFQMLCKVREIRDCD